METLQTIQQLAPATVAALLALPWAAALLMHAVSFAARPMLDDKWNSRAGAASRWAGSVARASGQRNPVAAQVRAHQPSIGANIGATQFAEPLPRAT